MSGAALPTPLKTHGLRAVLGRHPLVRLAGRYSLTAIGPVAVSGAHFVASIIFLHQFSPAEFGMFSFLLVVVPFCLSISSGLFGAPLLSAIGKAETVAGAKRTALNEVNRLYCLAAGAATAVAMYFSSAGKVSALLLGAYGAAMALRWYARFNAYNANQALRVAVSDFVYSAVLLTGLPFLALTGEMSLKRTSFVMLISAVLGLLPFGLAFLKAQFRPPARGVAAIYAPIWRDVTRWSLMGVVFSEATANAHAYLVTFIAGAHAFALLAIGSLMVRPISLVLASLPDRERPVIARALAAGDKQTALRTIVDFRIAGAAVWLGNAVLCVAILMWVPGLVIRSGFDAQSVEIVVALWILIMALRALRAPEAAFLTAAGEFHALARAGTFGSAASLGGVLIGLMMFGPVASLAGIVAGEGAMTVRILLLMARWRRAHD
ncbi:MAG TPA: hypothetical protein VG889_21830 [Rhizomicrobium sp.]|nr:hypothetical protein [Rhizomicrobium sp.]